MQCRAPRRAAYLVIRKPWPSMLRTIWGDNDRYLETYWERFQNRYYVAGDSAHRDEDGYFWIMGRIDDVLNVAGHRLGTMEIESALVAHPRVAEAAVVGEPHESRASPCSPMWSAGERPVGAAIESVPQELRDWVAEQLGAIAKPDDIRFADNLPEDALGQDHAPAAARDRARRGDHAGYVDAREPGDHRPAAWRRPAHEAIRGARQARQSSA